MLHVTSEVESREGADAPTGLPYDENAVVFTPHISNFGATAAGSSGGGERAIMEMCMPFFVNHESVSHPADQDRSRALPPRDRTLWARVPFQSKEGRCVALRMSGGALLVGVAAAPAPRWLPVEKVMNEADAKAWLMSGFS